MLNLYNAIDKLGASPISREDFSYSLQYQKWDIGIGSSPIGFERFVQPRKGQGESKTEMVLQ